MYVFSIKNSPTSPEKSFYPLESYFQKINHFFKRETFCFGVKKKIIAEYSPHGYRRSFIY